MKRTVRFLLAASMLLVLFFGCSLLPLTIQGRLSRFIEDINRGQYELRADTYLNFSPDISLYDEIQGYFPATSDYYWDIYFPQTDPASVYSISAIDDSDPSNVTATISAPGVPSFGTRAAMFVMTPDANLNYLISELWLEQGGPLTRIIW